MLHRVLKSVSIFIGICLAIFLIWAIYISYCFKFYEPTYSKEDLVSNYENKSKQIQELYAHINTITPLDKKVEIEFENCSNLAIFHVADSGSYNYDRNFNIDDDGKKADSLMNLLGWEMKDLRLLKSKLDNANCISIESGEPVTIGFKRSGMGMYFYKLFKENLNEKLIKKYNDSCIYIYYKQNVVLEFGGGVLGQQCFEIIYNNSSKK